MSITLFGVIWLTFSLFACLLSNIKYIFFMTIIGMVFQSDNVFIIGDTIGIGPQLITSCLFIFKSYLYSTNKSKLKTNKSLSILLLLLIYIIVNSFITPSETHYVQILMITTYLFTAYRMYAIKTFISTETVAKTIDIVTWFVLIEGFIAYLQALKVLPNYGVLKVLFYNDTISGVCAYNDYPDLTRLYSSFLEPSYCACFLVGAVFYYLIYRSDYKYRWLTLSCLGVAIVLTESSTAYGGLFITSIIYIFSRADKKALKYVLPIVALVTIVFYPYFRSLLEKVIISKQYTGSAMVRNNWNQSAIDSFLTNPLFGIGYKSQRASSLLYTMLGELGLIGVTIYSFFVFYIFRYGIIRKITTNQFRAASFWTIAVVVCQFIACPDLSLCVFWLSIYLLVLSPTEQEMKDN